VSTAGGQAPPVVSPGAQIRRKILRGSAWVFAGRMGSIVIGLAINALLARLLSRDGLGGYFVASSMVMIGSTLACLGMNKTVVRLVAGSLAVNRAGRARDTIRITFAVGTASALLLATVLALGPGRALATHLFGSSVVADAMPFVAGWLAAMTLQTLVAETYRGLKRFRAATLFSGLIVDVFSLAVFGTLWLQNAHPSLSEVLFIMLVVTALPAVYGVIRILLKLPRMRRGGGFTDTREVLGISLPLLIVSLSAFFVGTGVDIWVVGYFEPIDQVALYGAAAKLMFIVSTPLIIVSQVVPPIIAQLHEQRRHPELEHALRATATLTGLPAAAALILLMAGGAWVLELVYGSAFFRQASTVLVILGCARLYAVLTGSCGVALTMTGHQRLMMNITLLSAAVSFGLEVLLVQPFGIIGVACATCAAQILQNTMQLLMTKRALGIWTHAELSFRPVRELIGR
jgi:O-antigen/teichoic acid export membrane protein